MYYVYVTKVFSYQASGNTLISNSLILIILELSMPTWVVASTGHVLFYTVGDVTQWVTASSIFLAIIFGKDSKDLYYIQVYPKRDALTARYCLSWSTQLSQITGMPIWLTTNTISGARALKRSMRSGVLSLRTLISLKCRARLSKRRLCRKRPSPLRIGNW